MAVFRILQLPVALPLVKACPSFSTCAIACGPLFGNAYTFFTKEQFQTEYAGSGLSSRTIAEIYKKYKALSPGELEALRSRHSQYLSELTPEDVAQRQRQLELRAEKRLERKQRRVRKERRAAMFTPNATALFFMKEMRGGEMVTRTQEDCIEAMKLTAVKWKSLSDKKKKPFFKEAAKLRDERQKQLAKGLIHVPPLPDKDGKLDKKDLSTEKRKLTPPPQKKGQ